MKDLKNYITEWKYTTDSKVKREFVWSKTKFNSRGALRKEILNRLKASPKSLDLRDIDVSNITSFYNLFSFSEIETHPHMDVTMIDITGWDTSNVTDMDNMFWNCEKLEVIFGIEDFVMSSVDNLTSMFSGCTHLKKLDLSTWDTSAFKNCESMFYNCKGLEEIKGIEHWDLHLHGVGTNNMFYHVKQELKPKWFYKT